MINWEILNNLDLKYTVYDLQRNDLEFKLAHLRIRRRMKPITMITIHSDVEELPLFCMKLSDGALVTCYAREYQTGEEVALR